jgi:vacuolar-type H+-ATPase subunit H
MKELERLIDTQFIKLFETIKSPETQATDCIKIFKETKQAILKMFEEKDEEIRRAKEALKNQMQCVSELKEFLHNAKQRIVDLEQRLRNAEIQNVL